MNFKSNEELTISEAVEILLRVYSMLTFSIIEVTPSEDVYLNIDDKNYSSIVENFKKELVNGKSKGKIIGEQIFWAVQEVINKINEVNSSLEEKQK